MIRRVLVFFLALAAVTAGWVPAVLAGEVDWAEPPYEDMLKTAGSENKHVFIDFYATWCGPCQRLDKITYRDADVVEYLNGIVPAKYDAEKGEGEVLAEKFRIRSYPTLVLLDPSGREIDRHIGYLDPEGFLEIIRGYQNGINTVAYFEAQLEKNPDDPEILYELGMKHADAIRSGEAKRILDRILELEPDNENRAGIWSRLGYVMYSDSQYEEAVGYYNKLIDEFPDTDHHSEALRMLAYVYFKMDRRDDSIASYRKYLERHPNDPSAMNSFAWFCAQRKFGFEHALPVALEAADLSGRDPGILDTLAELYYAMGDYKNAVEVGEEALSKEPDDQYLKDQLEKFRSAYEGT
jgi:tetratricopeptide (TPR) repeat protein